MLTWERRELGEVEPIKVNEERPLRLLGIRSDIHPDGNAATCTIFPSGHKPQSFYMPLHEIGLLDTEFRKALSTMMAKQMVKPNCGSQVFEEMVAGAIKPVDSDVLIEPRTNDRIIVLYFLDRGPITLQMDQYRIMTLRRQQREAAAAVVN